MQYLYIAIKAALTAGEKILSIYNDPEANFQVVTKEDNSPLTIADKESHAAIYSFLQKTSFPLLSEEGEKLSYEQRKSWQELWVIDPLDGTKEFIKRNGEFTVNIARVRNGVPMLGVIYVPVKKELYYAMESIGAYKVTGMTIDTLPADLDRLLQQSCTLPLKGESRPIRVVASRSHLNEQTETYINQLKEKYPQLELVSSGSSLKLCLVAEGSADYYPRFAPTMEWDTAAGDAIARIAGCQVVEMPSGKPLQYNKENLLNPYFLVTQS